MFVVQSDESQQRRGRTSLGSSITVGFVISLKLSMHFYLKCSFILKTLTASVWV